MRLDRKTPFVALLALFAAPASFGTTLVRENLERLVTSHEAIVIGEVLEANSYWNSDHSFILTDVKIGVSEPLKGPADSNEILTVTLLGGTVGDLTTLIVGGAQLAPGRSYLLFLNQERLPGVERALTVRDHVQGAFDLDTDDNAQLVARSQANRQPLLGDSRGLTHPVGGSDGVPLDRLRVAIRTLDRQDSTRKEVR